MNDVQEKTSVAGSSPGPSDRLTLIQPAAKALRVKVASPCSASWEGMEGNDQVRFCAHCEHNVYNLSGMSKGEAEALVTGVEGKLCIRYYQRSDGSVITRDCPVGLRAARKHLAASISVGIALLLSIWMLVVRGVRVSFLPGRSTLPPSPIGGWNAFAAIPPRPMMGARVVLLRPDEANPAAKSVQMSRPTPKLRRPHRKSHKNRRLVVGTRA